MPERLFKVIRNDDIHRTVYHFLSVMFQKIV